MKKDEAYFEYRDGQFMTSCQAALSIFKEKNRQYNDAISRTGLLGASVEIVGVAARLEPLIINNKNFEEKLKEDPKFKASVLNAIADLHNYSVIAKMMIEDENWRGE